MARQPSAFRREVSNAPAATRYAGGGARAGVDGDAAETIFYELVSDKTVTDVLSSKRTLPCALGPRRPARRDRARRGEENR